MLTMNDLSIVIGSKKKEKKPMNDSDRTEIDYEKMLRVAIAEARTGLAEGGIPVGAALFDGNGNCLGRGRNRRVQDGDPSVHGETDAFRNAGRQKNYRDKIMVTTLAPCWYCSGLIRQFKIGTVVVGENVNFPGGIEWLRAAGVRIVLINSDECIKLMREYIESHPDVWNEDIGE
jgi:cytosine/creatinine deaminase